MSSGRATNFTVTLSQSVQHVSNCVTQLNSNILGPSDLILADMWALGMVFFLWINLSLKCPYLFVRSEGNIGKYCQDELKRFISSLLRRGKHPLDEKYEVERATV